MRGSGEEPRTQPGRLLITGGSGYLGHALAARARPDLDVTAARHTQPGPGPVLDVRDATAVGRLVGELRPEVVIHTAYLQSGEQMVDVNVAGAGNVARAVASVGARLIQRSRRPSNTKSVETCALDCSRAAGLLTAPVRGVRAVLGAGVPPAGQSLH